MNAPGPKPATYFLVANGVIVTAQQDEVGDLYVPINSKVGEPVTEACVIQANAEPALRTALEVVETELVTLKPRITGKYAENVSALLLIVRQALRGGA